MMFKEQKKKKLEKDKKFREWFKKIRKTRNEEREYWKMRGYPAGLKPWDEDKPCLRYTRLALLLRAFSAGFCLAAHWQ